MTVFSIGAKELDRHQGGCDVHIFAYGSLMNPSSLRTTLPHADLSACIPARLSGYVRSFDVGFPNDGSQTDKAYIDSRGEYPPLVLMCNIRPDENYNVNGICIPVNEADLHLLSNRELRYNLVDVTGEISAYPPASQSIPGPVMAFSGKPEFISTQGVSSRAYLDTIIDGALHWDEVTPEFYHLTMGCTLFPPGERIVNLEQIDGGQRP